MPAVSPPARALTAIRRLSLVAAVATGGLLIVGALVSEPGQSPSSLPVYRTNYLFRGMIVPAGERTIRLVYRPISALLGLGMPVLLDAFNVAPQLRETAAILIFATAAAMMLDLSFGAFSHVLGGLQLMVRQTGIWVVSFLLETALIIELPHSRIIRWF